jgi:membrane associated rhomboid family serine protease
MTFGPVGIRCPEHAGKTQSRSQRVVQRADVGSPRHPGIVTTVLIALNVGIYLLQLAQGARITGDSGSIFVNGALYGPAVADGDWYRLLSAAFLHYGPIHLGMNMLALWWIGRPLEDALGPIRYLLLYLVSGLAGSAGALIANPTGVTVGASGAIFGILGAAIVLERQRTYVLGGSAMTLLIINIAFTFAVPGVSIGGHLGGLVGGALAVLAFSRFGQRSAVYSRTDVFSIVSLVVIGIASIAVAYLKVRGYA